MRASNQIDSQISKEVSRIKSMNCIFLVFEIVLGVNVAIGFVVMGYFASQESVNAELLLFIVEPALIIGSSLIFIFSAIFLTHSVKSATGKK